NGEPRETFQQCETVGQTMRRLKRVFEIFKKFIQFFAMETTPAKIVWANKKPAGKPGGDFAV
ncbi:MAG: hypothetical protein AB1403_07585, partial [Candidatus Riflebacteria bacterium]